GESRYEAAVYSDLQSSEPETIIGVSKGRLVADLNAYRQIAFVEGTCPLTWRQGVKHDAAQVMELKKADQGWSNQLGERVEVEGEFVYPLIKGRELFLSERPQPDRYVVVPQRRIGDDTRGLELVAPRLWSYLNRHAEIFMRRKSAIYRNQPPFAIFGIGDYSFAPFKVGVSGLHKEPRFRLAPPTDEAPLQPAMPAMFDDTCYFLPCFSLEPAALLVALLNHRVTQSFIRATMFLDAKRPITKKLLQRIDLIKLLQHIGREELLAAADRELARWPNKAALSPPGWPNDLSSLLSERAGVKQSASQMNLFAKV
ncbi:MAG: SAM-dependent methyltransferase, partial [Blastocatellia bacterium]